MKTNRELKVWQFFTVDTDQRTCLVDEKECKSPNRTKLWAELQNKLDSDTHIESVGYCVKE